MNVIWVLIIVSDLWTSNPFIYNTSINTEQFHSQEACEEVKNIIIKNGGKIKYINCVSISDPARNSP